MKKERSADRLRVDAFLARAGLGTRSEVRRLIRSGRIALAGERCRRAGDHVEGRVVTLDDEVVTAPPDVLHLVLHKPVGYACSHDPNEAPIIEELLPVEYSRLGLQAAGRLDRETSGLLVMSTDGRVVHDLTHPARKVEKRYRIVFEGVLPSDAVERCVTGMLIEGSDRPTLPARLEIGEERRATIWLREGRFHQVRRMLERLGVEVVELHRDRVGDYDLPADLEPGDFLALDDDDLERLRSSSTL